MSRSWFSIFVTKYFCLNFYVKICVTKFFWLNLLCLVDWAPHLKTSYRFLNFQSDENDESGGDDGGLIARRRLVRLRPLPGAQKGRQSAQSGTKKAKKAEMTTLAKMTKKLEKAWFRISSKQTWLTTTTNLLLKSALGRQARPAHCSAVEHILRFFKNSGSDSDLYRRRRRPRRLRSQPGRNFRTQASFWHTICISTKRE